MLIWNILLFNNAQVLLLLALEETMNIQAKGINMYYIMVCDMFLHINQVGNLTGCDPKMSWMGVVMTIEKVDVVTSVKFVL